MDYLTKRTLLEELDLAIDETDDEAEKEFLKVQRGGIATGITHTVAELKEESEEFAEKEREIIDEYKDMVSFIVYKDVEDCKIFLKLIEKHEGYLKAHNKILEIIRGLTK